jgi:hypothetical protein
VVLPIVPYVVWALKTNCTIVDGTGLQKHTYVPGTGHPFIWRDTAPLNSWAVAWHQKARRGGRIHWVSDLEILAKSPVLCGSETLPCSVPNLSLAVKQEYNSWWKMCQDTESPKIPPRGKTSNPVTYPQNSRQVGIVWIWVRGQVGAVFILASPAYLPAIRCTCSVAGRSKLV